MDSYACYRLHKVVWALILFIGLSVFSAMHQAKAVTVVWSLENASFDDGGSVSGSFSWDTELNAVLSWNFTVTGGNTANFSSPFTYSNTLSNHFGAYLPSVDFLYFADFTQDVRGFRIGLIDEDSLDIPVSMLALDPVFGTGSNGYLECFDCSPLRFGIEGAYLSAVPIPAAIWFFGTALVGLVGFSKLRKPA